jgi:hypothetical protein
MSNDERVLLDAAQAGRPGSREILADLLEERGHRAEARYVRLEAGLDTAPDAEFPQLLLEFRDVTSKVPLDFRAAVSRPNIEGCVTRGIDDCPTQWTRLERTDDPGVRRCTSCARQVHFCPSVEEAEARVRNGQRVVVDVAQLRRGRLAPTESLHAFLARHEDRTLSLEWFEAQLKEAGGRGVQRSSPTSDGRLQLQLVMLPGQVSEQRMAVLCLRNVSQDPLRFLMLRAAFFRSPFSWLRLSQAQAAQLEPRSPPHGYNLGEADFHLLQPDQGALFFQRFILDELDAAAPVDVEWTFTNERRRWEGGLETLDGPTRALFGGEDVPFLWLGRLSARLRWSVEG